MALELDGNSMNDIQMNGTTCIGGVTPVFSKNLKDGDHQLAGRVSQLNGGYFVMEDLECVCPCSTPSQLQLC